MLTTEQHWQAILDEHRARAHRATEHIVSNPSEDVLTAIMVGSMAQQIADLRNVLQVARASNQLSGTAYTKVCNALERG